MTARLILLGGCGALVIGAAFFLSGAARHASREFSAEALAATRPAVAVLPLRIRHRIATMTLEEKIGQMMMVSISGTELADGTAAWLASHYIGGVILLGKNVRNRAQTERLIHDLQARGRTSGSPPLFIAVDQEGGTVSRFRFLEEMRPQRELNSMDDAYAAARRRGEELKAMGVSVNFSPVMDVAASPGDFIANRAFRGSAATVAAQGSAMIRGYHDAGIIAVPKHFPGHGGTGTDSHTSLPTVAHDTVARETNLMPFREAIAAGASMMMTAHLLVPSVDAQYPASISRVFGRILRHDLGYGGVIITDDLAMGAIRRTYSLPNATVRAAAAGADILLAVDAPGQYDDVYTALTASVQRGDLDVDDVNASVGRIMTLKEAFLMR